MTAARALAGALADWGPMVAARFAVKADRDVTADDRARFALVLIGAAPFNALAAGVPIVPAALSGTERLNRFGPLRVVYGKPIPVEGHARVLTKRMMTAIAELQTQL